MYLVATETKDGVYNSIVTTTQVIFLIKKCYKSRVSEKNYRLWSRVMLANIVVELK